MRSDDTAGLRPASGRNPQDSGNVTSGEETTIQIPRSGGGAEELLDRLDADREAVREADIEALEAETDRAVYDPFESTDEELEVVEEYLDVV